MDLLEKIKILNNHLGAKNFKKVIDGSKILLNKIPDNDYLLNLTGMAYQGLSNHENSIKFFNQALKFAPNNIAAMNNLANSYKAIGKLEDANDLYEKILNINPNYINAYNNHANLKTLVNDYKGAIELYLKAYDLIKNNENIPKKSVIGILFSLAVAYQSDNRIYETKKTVNKILSIDSSHVGAHKLLSSLTRYSNQDEDSMTHIKQMEEIDKKISSKEYEKKVDLSYALGKSFEDIKDYEKSFFYLSRANNLKFEKKGSNLEYEKKAIRNIIKTFEGIDLNKSNNEAQDKKIIFILGMPRSGTTLIEQIVASHNKVYGAGELIYLQKVLKKNFVNDSKYQKQIIIDHQNLSKNVIFKEYIEHFNLYNFNENIITDKAPQNFRLIGFIKLFFPNSKVLHCFRNPKDNCLSLYKNTFASNMMNWTNKAEDIAEYYNLYSEIMKFWKQKISNFIHDIEYEKLIADKESEIRKILNFCELDWDEKCLSPEKNSKTPIKTVSIAQARQPIYKSSLNNSTNFDKHLSKMFSILKL
jgi:tetratricopeptide (TPR) repeat protein